MKTARSVTKTAILLTVIMGLLVFLSGCSTVESSNSPEPFKVASVQFNPVLNERDKNVKSLYKVVEEAFNNGAKLVVAPEMATTGYYYKDREAITPFVDTVPGSTTEKFAELTKKYDAYVVFGMPEVDKETGIYYNSAALVGPEGYIGKYRKMHQWETEEHWAAWGDLGVPVFDTKLGKIAINICMDSAYWETARLAALAGADILAFPTNSSAQAISALPARAEQNGLFIVSANRSNTENGFHMIGASAVWSPDGKKLAEAKLVPTEKEDINTPTITYAEIDPKQYDNPAKRRLAQRRPEIYKDLMLYIAPWDYTKNSTSHDIRAAILQYEPAIGDKRANQAKVKQKLEEAQTQAAQKKMQLVVLPELSLTGPVNGLNNEKIKELSETEKGDTVTFMATLAHEYKVNVVFGLIEQEKGKLYNTAILMSPDGKVLGKYRKTHLTDVEKAWAQAGDKLTVFDVEGLGKIGILIGEDAAYPETAGVMAVKRADVVAVPSSWNGQYSGTMKLNENISANKYPKGTVVAWDSLAIGAQAYTLVANFVGTDKGYLGSSGLFTLDPLYGLDQPVVASQTEEAALVVDFKTIQPDWWFNQEMLILSRRPPYYQPLILEAKK